MSQVHSSRPLTIVLLGQAGVGKSASGNTILRRPAFKSELSFKPVTTKISKQRGTVFGKQISVVDTPGVLETKTTEEIKKNCQKLLDDISSTSEKEDKMSSTGKKKRKMPFRPISPSKIKKVGETSSTGKKEGKTSSQQNEHNDCLFLVVVRVGLFTEEDQKAVRAAMEVLGPRGVEKSYLLFTGGDMLKGRPLEDFIFQDEGEEEKEGILPEVVRKFAGQFHLFNNEKVDEEQVRELLLKSGHLPPQDQAASPDDGGQQHGTTDTPRTDAGQPTSPEYDWFKERIWPIAGLTIARKLGTAIARSVPSSVIYQATQTVLKGVKSLEEFLKIFREIVNNLVSLKKEFEKLKSEEWKIDENSSIFDSLQRIIHLLGKLLYAIISAASKLTQETKNGTSG